METRKHPSVDTKKALVKVFGRDSVSVQRGKGTAYGWVNAEIKVRKSDICECPEIIREYREMCDNCKVIREQSINIAMDAVKDVEFYTYYGDSDDRKIDKFILDVELL